MSETPVSFAPPTRNPDCTSFRIKEQHAAVFPEFMQVPATYTTGGQFFFPSLKAFIEMFAGLPIRD